MSLADAYNVLKKLILIEERISRMSDKVDALALTLQKHGERLDRLESNIESLEHSLPSRRKLPEKAWAAFETHPYSKAAIPVTRSPMTSV